MAAIDDPFAQLALFEIGDGRDRVARVSARRARNLPVDQVRRSSHNRNEDEQEEEGRPDAEGRFGRLAVVLGVLIRRSAAKEREEKSRGDGDEQPAFEGLDRGQQRGIGNQETEECV
jgi:hypothetical protein